MRNHLVLLSCLLLASCAYEKEKFENRTVDSVYAKGCSLLKEGEYTDAASEFKDIDTLFPYASKAREGQILSAYCRFLASEYMDALREIEVFLRYHPSHELVPYAMYLKAMCIYMQVSSVGRDSKKAIDAKQAFIELANKFPHSPYYEDCIKRVFILDDIIAAHEMVIGRFYQNNKSHLSAINRYTAVATQLSHTDHTTEALYRIVECCNSLGLKEEAESSYQVLSTKYKDSSWTKKAGALLKK